MVVGNSVPGRLSNFDKNRTRAYCACSRYNVQMGVVETFFSPLSYRFHFSLSLEDGSI